MNQTCKMALSSSLTIPSMAESLSSKPQSSSSSSNPSSQSDDTFTVTMILLLGPIIELVGSFIIKRWFLPAYIQTSPQRIFKWRTTQIARITAGITGIMAIYALHDNDVLIRDTLHGNTKASLYCIVFSLGVHVAETIEMILYKQYSFLTIHHILAVACLFAASYCTMVQGFAVIFLVPEINAVFNKTRILHLVADLDRNSLEYTINSYINVFTFFLRVLIVAWLHGQSFQLFVDKPDVLFTTCFICTSFVNFWNMTCFKTLVIKDVLRKKKVL